MTRTWKDVGTRLAEIVAADAEVSARLPLRTVSDAVDRCPGALSRIVETIMLGYADRPALGERPAVPQAPGVPSDRLEPRYHTISYREAWRRARSISAAWQHRSARLLGSDQFLGSDQLLGPGDVLCTLGSTSIDYAILELSAIATGAVSVPVAASGPVAHWTYALRETRPRALAVSVDLLDAVLTALPPDLIPPTVIVMGRAGSADRVDQAVLGARASLAGTDRHTEVHTLRSLDERGRDVAPVPLFVPSAGTEPLAQIFYTSGSTGAPKGAMFPEHVVAQAWRSAAQRQLPAIVLHYQPMSHIAGRIALVGALARGGTCYFVGRGDMSTLLEDLSLVRPTELPVIPRVCEIIRDRFTVDVEAKIAAGADPDEARRQVLADLRDRVLGGRVVVTGNGSALLNDDLRAFMQELLQAPLPDGYGTTEAGGPVIIDNKVQRPPVIDYKLVDVPELGYFATDRPHPRGELLLKTTSMIPGYFNKPELDAELFDPDGFYRTGDVMVQTAPDELHFVDRRNNVLKLSQAEFVAVSRIEDVLGGSPLIDQIFVYGRSGRSYLVAVVVPTRRATESFPDPVALKAAVAQSIRARAGEADLHSYEIPRDFVVEREPFSVDNGLLSGLGKLLRPKLTERYEDQLERLYGDLADQQVAGLASLRHGADDRPVIDTVLRAAGALVGRNTTELVPAMSFAELGGDSLAALSFSTLLQDVYEVEVPVSVVVGPTTTLGDIADLIEAARTVGPTPQPTARSVHSGGNVLRAADLALDRFLDDATLAAAPQLMTSPRQPRTVLLTGANGFLGRFLALELLETLDCHVVCLVRGGNLAAARRRLEQPFDTGDPDLVERFRTLAADRLRVIVGDIGETDLGMTRAQWRRLADTVDTIVHPAAMVNHVLPYDQLFGPNVRGTAEVIRLALTSHLKHVVFLSTTGIGDQVAGTLSEEDDIRASNPVRRLTSAHASGYATSKWTAEVLLHNAHEHFGLPVTVFRSGLIFAHRRYGGQLNPMDTLTRLILSILITGVAPTSFDKARSTDGGGAAHRGLPVDFLAESVVRLGVAHVDRGARTFNATSPDLRGPTLDTFVDWLIDSGAPVTRIDDHAEWLRRFEIGLRSAPARIAPFTALPLLEIFRSPADTKPMTPPSTRQFCSAVKDARIGGSGEVPAISRQLIAKYVSDLAALGMTGD